MTWMIPSVIATMTSTFLLSLVYIYLYSVYRERYIGIWAASWSVCSFRYVFELYGLFAAASTAPAILSQLFSLLSGLLLLWGSYTFTGRNMSKWWVFGACLTAIWTAAGNVAGLSFYMLTLPTFLFLAAIYIWTGIIFLKLRHFQGTGKNVTGAAFILWGIHKADYPFLRPVIWLAPWGYLLASVLTVTVAVGVLLVYFQKTRDDLTESKKLVQASNEELEATVEELSAVEEELRQQYEELQEKEAYLQESERRFRSMMESIRLIAVVLDKSGNIIFCNEFIQELTGWKRDEIMGRSYFDIFIPPDRRESARQMSARSLKKGDIVVQHIQTRDGGLRLIHFYNTVLYDSSGNLIGTASIGKDVTDRVKAEKALRESEESYRTIFENTGTATVIVEKDSTIALVNMEFVKLSGYSKEETEGRKKFIDFIAGEDRERINEYSLLRRTEPAKAPRNYEFKFVDRHGIIKDVFVTVAIIPETKRILASLLDISRRKQAETIVRKSRDFYLGLLEDFPALIWRSGVDGQYNYFNKSWFSFTGSRMEQYPGFGMKEAVHPDDLDRFVQTYTDAFRARKKFELECRLRRHDGEYRWVVNFGSPFNDIEGNYAGYIGSCYDITERRMAEEKLKYLSLHDSLSGLYNRTYFEEEMSRLAKGRQYPIGIILCDVDGLKLVNDTLGHDAGDRLLVAAAGVIESSFRKEDMIARIGGDEFAVLLPNTPRDKVERAYHRIQENCLKYNQSNPDLPLSMSVGFAVSNGKLTDLNDVFKSADNSMYREKLHRRQSTRSAIVQTLMKALEARDYITEGHADRLQSLVEKLALSIGMSDHSISDLRLFAQFHDIGKVGIPDRILFKPGRLTDEEFAEMQRHCEIGHRIAQSAPDLAHLADWILKHHEWWNGQGYPLGLSGKDIPLECRILSIADAYDAMTSDRPYRKSLKHSEALEEIKRYSGVQFDPDLVAAFVKVIGEC